MRKAMRLTAAISLAATLALSLSAMAQDRDHRPDHHPGGPPGQHPGPGPGFHPPGPPGAHPAPGPAFHPPGPGGPHIVHPLGDRGYSFRGPSGVRREIVAFSPREREIWHRGRWHHEMRFGRYGYWYEVNGAWYFYDQPFDGPPTFVSEVEFVDPDLDPDDGGAAVVAPAPVVVVPPPVVVVPPPVVCVGPLCVR